jgi:hypothetical protein
MSPPAFNSQAARTNSPTANTHLFLSTRGTASGLQQILSLPQHAAQLASAERHCQSIFTSQRWQIPAQTAQTPKKNNTMLMTMSPNTNTMLATPTCSCQGVGQHQDSSNELTMKT